MNKFRNLLSTRAITCPTLSSPSPSHRGKGQVKSSSCRPGWAQDEDRYSTRHAGWTTAPSCHPTKCARSKCPPPSATAAKKPWEPPADKAFGGTRESSCLDKLMDKLAEANLSTVTRTWVEEALKHNMDHSESIWPVVKDPVCCEIRRTTSSEARGANAPGVPMFDKGTVGASRVVARPDLNGHGRILEGRSANGRHKVQVMGEAMMLKESNLSKSPAFANDDSSAASSDEADEKNEPYSSIWDTDFSFDLNTADLVVPDLLAPRADRSIRSPARRGASAKRNALPNAVLQELDSNPTPRPIASGAFSGGDAKLPQRISRRPRRCCVVSIASVAGLRSSRVYYARGWRQASRRGRTRLRSHH